MRAAIIKDNKVVNIIEIISVEDAESFNAIVTNEADIGDTWNGSVFLPPTRSMDEEWKEIKIIRNDKLQNSDWTQLSDSPLSDAKRNEWSIYRQLLRDLPQIYVNPHQIIWPQEPSSD